jgi:hypothetical protein
MGGNDNEKSEGLKKSRRRYIFATCKRETTNGFKSANGKKDLSIDFERTMFPDVDIAYKIPPCF